MGAKIRKFLEKTKELCLYFLKSLFLYHFLINFAPNLQHYYINMSKKLTILIAFLCAASCQISAQTVDSQFTSQPMSKSTSWSAFKHLDLGLELGTTGIGVQLSTPLASWARLRTGFTYMPAIEVPMTFGIQVGNDPSKSKSRFQKMSKLVYDNYGMVLDDEVDMIGKPANFWNWNVIVDIYPLKNNKHWHISGGFYLGPSHIAKAYNTTEDMQSLLAVNIYNNLYGKFVNDRMDYYNQQGTDHYIPEVLYEVKLFDLSALGEQYNFNTDPYMLDMLYKKFKDYGAMGVRVGDYVNDVYYPEDVYLTLEDGTQVLMHKAGDVLHAAGDPYIMRPDVTGMVKADMHVNRFKPYVGIGYEGNLSKKDDRWKIAVDGGVLFWGGSPEVITHEGVDLVHDVKNVSGKVGSYVDAIEKFKVYPMLNVRFTRRLF